MQLTPRTNETLSPCGIPFGTFGLIFYLHHLQLLTKDSLFYRSIVDEANKVAPAFSKIFKEMRLISSPDKPLPQAGKGTTMRKATLSLYDQEIDDM